MSRSTVIEIPDDVSALDDEDLDAFGPPTWRDRMAFGFARELVDRRAELDYELEDIANKAYRLADAMIEQSKIRVE